MEIKTRFYYHGGHGVCFPTGIEIDGEDWHHEWVAVSDAEPGIKLETAVEVPGFPAFDALKFDGRGSTLKAYIGRHVVWTHRYMSEIDYSIEMVDDNISVETMTVNSEDIYRFGA